MLAIHWSPVKNTKKILKNGILKSRNGLYCFPLTGEKNLDQWWVKLFNQWKGKGYRVPYNGFVFRIEKEDMPACFDEYYDYTNADTFEMQINTIEELELRYRERIIQAIGKKILKLEVSKTEEFLKKKNERIANFPSFYKSINDPELSDYVFKDWLFHQILERCKGMSSFRDNIEENKIFKEKGNNEIQKNEDLLKGVFNDFDLLDDAFSTWQIILSRSIGPNRIIKIISNQDEYGKILHKNKKYEYTNFSEGF
jgi:hypothetical protein